MVDISLINAYHIYKEIFSDPKCSRFKFLELLADSLVKEHLDKTGNSVNIDVSFPRDLNKSRKRCGLCLRAHDKNKYSMFFL